MDETEFDRLCLVALECASSDDAKRELTALREWVKHRAGQPASDGPVLGVLFRHP